MFAVLCRQADGRVVERPSRWMIRNLKRYVTDLFVHVCIATWLHALFFIKIPASFSLLRLDILINAISQSATKLIYTSSKSIKWGIKTP